MDNPNRRDVQDLDPEMEKDPRPAVHTLTSVLCSLACVEMSWVDVFLRFLASFFHMFLEGQLICFDCFLLRRLLMHDIMWLFFLGGSLC